MSTKSNLLKTLEKNKGNFVSGQELARILDISRTSIWKAIKELKDEGYPIEAVTNRGYMLSEQSSILSAEAIEEYLEFPDETASIKVFKSIDSTNNEAKRLLMDESRTENIIFAEEQSSGRGRLGRSFLSPPGHSIYVSFILEPRLDVKDSLLITVAASVAVSRAVKIIGAINNEQFDPKIKWVNDIFQDDKKICGILTEAVSDVETGQIQSLILGIGININIDAKSYPKEIRNIAGGLSIEPGQRNRFAAILVDQVLKIQNEIYDFITSSDTEPSFMKEYRQSSLVLGKEITVIKGESKIKANALDIDGRGGLMVKYKTGETELLNTGEISIRLDH